MESSLKGLIHVLEDAATLEEANSGQVEGQKSVVGNFILEGLSPSRMMKAFEILDSMSVRVVNRKGDLIPPVSGMDKVYTRRGDLTPPISGMDKVYTKRKFRSSIVG